MQRFNCCNELVATVQYARSEAVRLNGRVMLCPSTNGTSCSGDDWSQLIVLAVRTDEVLRQFSGNGKAAITADDHETLDAPLGCAFGGLSH